VPASRPGADASIMAATVLQAVGEMHLPDTLRAEFAGAMRVFAETAAADEILILAVPARSPRGFPASALDGGGKHRGHPRLSTTARWRGTGTADHLDVR
jgi:hypothetical protein